MAGILNSKTRVIDFIITEQGREQAANGELQIKYATFSDRDTFYSKDLDGVAAAADGRIFFEASGRAQDLIVVETTPQGTMKPFRTADFDLDGTNVVTGSFSYADSASSTLLTGSQYSSLSEKIVDNVIQHLSGTLGAEVELTLTIAAKHKDGFNENVKRAVLENCNTLGFESHEFHEG